jgi:hypothetical protein
MFMTKKHILIAFSLLATVSCGNCEDKRHDQPQPGTPPGNPAQAAPHVRNFRFPQLFVDGSTAAPSSSAPSPN